MRRSGVAVSGLFPDRAKLLSIFLVFTHKRDTDERRPSWSEARILHEDWRKKKLGDTGWAHQRKWRERLLRIEGEGEEMFASIARKLRANKLVTFDRESMKMACADLADIFWAINGRIPDLSVTRMEDELLPGDEEAEFDALTFIDDQGRRIHLCLRQGDGRGHIYADGEEIAWIQTDELQKTAEFAVTLSTGIDVGKFTLRR